LRGELKSLPTGGNTLLFFDFSPFEKPVFGGYRIRFHMYSLTGRVANPAAWKMTLKGADGLVIVVDDAPEKLPATRENISLLRDFLGAYGGGLHDIPCVLQLNRVAGSLRSSAVVTAAELGVPDMPVCLSRAANGEGVLEALSQLSRDIVGRIGKSDALQKPVEDEFPDNGEDSVSPAVSTPSVIGEMLNPPDTVRSHFEEPVTGLGGAGDAGDEIRITLAEKGADVVDGVVRVPVEIMLDGVKRRLVVSIAIGPG
jgi:hypothetical protein